MSDRRSCAEHAFEDVEHLRGVVDRYRIDQPDTISEHQAVLRLADVMCVPPNEVVKTPQVNLAVPELAWQLRIDGAETWACENSRSGCARTATALRSEKELVGVETEREGQA